MPADLLRVAKLRLFGELLQSGPPVVFALMAGLLMLPEQTPNLYGFPALHPLDPLSRLDIDGSAQSAAPYAFDSPVQR